MAPTKQTPQTAPSSPHYGLDHEVAALTIQLYWRSRRSQRPNHTPPGGAPCSQSLMSLRRGCLPYQAPHSCTACKCSEDSSNVIPWPTDPRNAAGGPQAAAASTAAALRAGQGALNSPAAQSQGPSSLSAGSKLQQPQPASVPRPQPAQTSRQPAVQSTSPVRNPCQVRPTARPRPGTASSAGQVVGPPSSSPAQRGQKPPQARTPRSSTAPAAGGFPKARAQTSQGCPAAAAQQVSQPGVASASTAGTAAEQETASSLAQQQQGKAPDPQAQPCQPSTGPAAEASPAKAQAHSASGAGRNEAGLAPSSSRQPAAVSPASEDHSLQDCCAVPTQPLSSMATAQTPHGHPAMHASTEAEAAAASRPQLASSQTADPAPADGYQAPTVPGKQPAPARAAAQAQPTPSSGAPGALKSKAAPAKGRAASAGLHAGVLQPAHARGGPAGSAGAQQSLVEQQTHARGRPAGSAGAPQSLVEQQTHARGRPAGSAGAQQSLDEQLAQEVRAGRLAALQQEQAAGGQLPLPKRPAGVASHPGSPAAAAQPGQPCRGPQLSPLPLTGRSEASHTAPAVSPADGWHRVGRAAPAASATVPVTEVARVPAGPVLPAGGSAEVHLLLAHEASIQASGAGSSKAAKGGAGLQQVWELLEASENQVQHCLRQTWLLSVLRM